MSTATEITRLQTARNTIRNKLVSFGLAESSAKLDDLAEIIDDISYQGAVMANVQEGDSYTIPAGYHNGSGVVAGIAGGGNYSLQSKGPVTPTKSSQSIAPDDGYYGLSAVTIAAIPEAYQDVSSVTSLPADVLATKIFVTSEGAVTAGTMVNNGAISKVLDATTNNQSYLVPAGYHNGSGTVGITLESLSVTPSTSSQTITPATGRVIGSVTVDAIPSNFKDTTNTNAIAADILSGKIVVTGSGEVTGSMTNNGAVDITLDATSGNQSYTVPVGYHNGSGTVSIVLDTETVTPDVTSQTITPVSGKVLGSVIVEGIPLNFADVSEDDAVAANLLAGVKAHTAVNGLAAQITGTMRNNGDVSGSIDGLSTTSYTILSGYTSGGTISLTGDIENALMAI